MTDAPKLPDRQEMAEFGRLLTNRRRPQQVPLVHRTYLAQLQNTIQYGGVRAKTTAVSALNRLAIGREALLLSNLKHSDTVLYFAGGDFCDLMAATDTPPVTDLEVLLRSGNHTILVVFERNIATGNEGDDLVAVALYLADSRNDFLTPGRRLVGCVLHMDNTWSTFLYPFKNEMNDQYASVDWNAGVNERTGDLTLEERLVSNTLGLLAQQSVVTQTRWKHYPRALVTQAAMVGRKLPAINVIGLSRTTRHDLSEHQEAVEREGWWPVRGHFRMQPYGPNRQHRKLIYVGPSRRGNLDGPMIGRPQVHRAH